MYRVLRPLLRPEADVLPRWLLHGLEGAGDFALNLVGVLSLAVLAVALLWVVGKGMLGESAGGRLAFGLVASLWVPLSALAMFAPGRIDAWGIGMARATFLLQVSFICLALLAMLSALPARGQGRVKVGLLLLLVPLLLHFEAYFNLATGRRAEGVGALLLLGQGTVVLALILSPICFLPGEREKGGPGMALGLAAAAICSLTFLAVVLLDWEMAARLLQSVAGMRLPTTRWVQGLYILGAGDLVFTAVALLALGGALQLRGFGLALLGMAGYRLQSNSELALSLIGLLCIARSSLSLPMSHTRMTARALTPAPAVT